MDRGDLLEESLSESQLRAIFQTWDANRLVVRRREGNFALCFDGGTQRRLSMPLTSVQVSPSGRTTVRPQASRSGTFTSTSQEPWTLAAPNGVPLKSSLSPRQNSLPSKFEPTGRLRRRHVDRTRSLGNRHSLTSGSGVFRVAAQSYGAGEGLMMLTSTGVGASSRGTAQDTV